MEIYLFEKFLVIWIEATDFRICKHQSSKPNSVPVSRVEVIPLLFWIILLQHLQKNVVMTSLSDPPLSQKGGVGGTRAIAHSIIHWCYWCWSSSGMSHKVFQTWTLYAVGARTDDQQFLQSCDLVTVNSHLLQQPSTSNSWHRFIPAMAGHSAITNQLSSSCKIDLDFQYASYTASYFYKQYKVSISGFDTISTL